MKKLTEKKRKQYIRLTVALELILVVLVVYGLASGSL